MLILDDFGKPHVGRAILDSGSQSNFMTQEFADKLRLKKHPLSVSVAGLGSLTTLIEYSVNATIVSVNKNYTASGSFLILPKILNKLPSQSIDKNMLAIPSSMELADPTFYIPGQIHMILGEYFFYKALKKEQIRLADDNIVMQNTVFGWILSGEISPSRCHNSKIKNYTSQTLEGQLENFWKLEEYAHVKHQSDEERACEMYFKETTRRDATGRYVVRLPFNSRKEQLGESFNMAVKRFESLERRLKVDAELRSHYITFLNEYEMLGHMTRVTDDQNVTNNYFLPHHAVKKMSSITTKVRVVFDASAKTSSGLSLNDTLLVGPILQDDIFRMLIKFRRHVIVLTADIEKMYRQILVHPQDRPYQRILWRQNPEDRLQVFELNTVTYGTASAPYLAVRCLQQLADDEGKNFPMAARALREDFYMDDLLTGASNLQDAKQLRDELLELTKRGGLNLRQWASNCLDVIVDLHSDNKTEHLLADVSESKKTLGIYWNSDKDIFGYKFNARDVLTRNITKRTLLSEISRLFDPLGLLGPIIVKAKLLIQDLWKLKLGWDDMLPQRIQQNWFTVRDQLVLVKDLTFPRTVVLLDSLNIEIHGFCDASQRAYGACVYVRSTDVHGNVAVTLLCGKSRVAPIKTQSLPRLELCGALLLSRLIRVVLDTMGLNSERIVLWSDSMIALQWIKSSAHNLKTFVANRVAEIQEITDQNSWRHIGSEDNPTDSLSRGQSVSEFRENRLWFAGPSWLSQPEESWPNHEIILKSVPEIREAIICVSIVQGCDWFTKFSSFDKLKRVVAYCMRMLPKTKRLHRDSSMVNNLELERSHNIIMRAIQAETFSVDLKNLSKEGTVDNKSKILPLAPFLDAEGIIRVGGRLRNAEIPYSSKFPILLPKSHHISKLIVKEYHIKYMHAGIQHTLSAVRQKYWPIDGKNLARFINRNCMQCFRANPKTSLDYCMADLPKNRVVASRPFENVGIDYCGPFFIKEKKYRNQKKIKVYVAVFICFATKAVHLELVSDLTSEAFLASLRRFFARRGYAKNIYSDNGTNFIGAQRELKELFLRPEYRQQIEGAMTANNINWHFSPPRAPHFGGLWEAAVKSFKYHFVRVVGDVLFTYEQFETYMIEIEAILNSRPLTPLSSDPNDLQTLTPAHFLIGTHLHSISEADLSEVPSNRLSTWKHLQKLKQNFWKRWHKEYLNELNIRTKWQQNNGQVVQEEMLVLIKEDNCPPMQWPMGRIIRVYPGADGIIRVVDVKTHSGVYKRGVVKLCPLPQSSV